MLSYALKIADRYDGMLLATFPDVPEAIATGRDYEEACEQAKCALEAALQIYEEEGRAFPPARASGRLVVTTERFGAMTPA